LYLIKIQLSIDYFAFVCVNNKPEAHRLPLSGVRAVGKAGLAITNNKQSLAKTYKVCSQAICGWHHLIAFGSVEVFIPA
jgi:hypothetical protein